MANQYQGEYDRSYQLYRQYCENLAVPPAEYQKWLIMSAKIGELYFTDMPARKWH